MNSLLEDQGREESNLHYTLRHCFSARKEFEEREPIGCELYSFGAGDSWHCFDPFPPQYLKTPKIKPKAQGEDHLQRMMS